MLETYDDVIKRGGLPCVVPPTSDKAVETIHRLDWNPTYVWSQAIEALKQATRVIIVGFSFRLIDAHFKYLLAAGLMENSALRRIVVINPQASKLVRQIRSVIRRDQFVYGVVRLHDQHVHEFAVSPDNLKEIGRLPKHKALSIVDLGNVRLMVSSEGVVVGRVG